MLTYRSTEIRLDFVHMQLDDLSALWLAYIYFHKDNDQPKTHKFKHEIPLHRAIGHAGSVLSIIKRYI